jgi:hypothetical protein
MVNNHQSARRDTLSMTMPSVEAPQSVLARYYTDR